MRRRTRFLRAALASLAVCAGVSAQRQDEGQAKVPCIHESKVTRASAGPGDDGSAWTTARAGRDGLLALTFCGVFRSGGTTARRIAPSELPTLPTGYAPHVRYGRMVGESIRYAGLPPGLRVYRGMAFEITTRAVPNMTYVTFRLPSVRTEGEFKRLYVLYLDEDPMVPGLLSWTMYPLGLDIPKPDFRSRTLSAFFQFSSVFHHATGVGRVVVVTADEQAAPPPRVDLLVEGFKGPEPAKVGDTLTYQVTVANSAGTGATATGVILNTSFHGGAYRFASARVSQGGCRQSVNSTPEVICELGSIADGGKVTVQITVRVERSAMNAPGLRPSFLTMNMVRAREAETNYDNNHHQSNPVTLDP